MLQATAYVDTMAGEELARLQLLRDLFAAAPDEELLGRLAKQAEHDEALQRLAQAAREESKEILAAEWMRLFEGPGRYPVVLFGSYYLDGKKLMGPSTLATRQFYRQYEMEPGTNIPADHIAYELGFLGFLTASAQMADAQLNASGERKAFLSTRTEFLRQMMLPWVQPMVEILNGATGISYFHRLGELLLAILRNMEAAS